VAPVFLEAGKQGTHQWLIEFENPPGDSKKFIAILDNTLQSVNSDYEAKRYKDIALRMPDLEIARPGLFQDWLKSKGRLGGQNKVPRLSNDRKYMDELLAFNAQ
jgi:hypothetical protein